MSVLSPPRTARPAGRRAGNPTLILSIILTCQLMVILDATVVTIALPQIHAALGFSPTGLSWVQNAYTLTFGGLLLLGARAGDILGRRRVFLAGIALFTAASLAGGLAQSAEWLLVARAVQGVGAAVAAPSALALLTTSFAEGSQRLRALGLYAAVSSGGGSVGLVVGGMLTDWISWRWGLFVNVPIGIALVALAPRHLPETPRRPGRFDLPGAATSTLGIGALVYGFVRAASDGWTDPTTLVAFVAAAALLATFVRVELRAEQPITPLRLFASRERSASFLARLLLVGGMFGMFFFLTQFLQGVRDYSALKAGFAFLPMTVTMFASVRIVPRLIPRVGGRRLMLGGTALALGAMLWLTRLTAGSGYLPDLLVPMLLLGLGIGIAFVPLTNASLAGVAPAEAGAASGLINVTQQVGGSVGLAILVTVFGTASRHAAHHPLAHASSVVAQQHALAHAIAASFTASAVFLGLTFAVLLLGVRVTGSGGRRADGEAR